MKTLFRKKIFWFFIIGILLGVAAWKLIPGLNGKNKDTDKTYTVKQEALKETLTISGEIEANKKTTLRFQTSGHLAWVGVTLYDTVKKNQAIASLDKEELQKNLEKYLNTYMVDRMDFETTKEEYRAPAQDYWNFSWDQRNALDRALQEAQFDLNSSVLDVEIKNIALKYATLISPINGIVTKIGSPVAGVNITPAQAEFEIVDPDTLYFSLLPDQDEVAMLSSSMSAQLIFDAYPEETVEGVITAIAFSPKSGATSTVYETKIAFPLNDPSHIKYRLGMTGDAIFTTKEKSGVLAIPHTYIQFEKDKKYVMKKSGDKKEKVYVETGLEGDDLTEITSGLAEGDIIYD